MAARTTLVFIALVVGTALCTATRAKPPTDQPSAKSSVAPDYTECSYDANFGRIGQLHPTMAGVFFKLAGGQTAMKPRSGYYLVDKDHPTFQAMCDLLYLAAKERWEVSAHTESTLNENGYAVVVNVIANFPADDPPAGVAHGPSIATPQGGSPGPGLEMGSYVLPCERRPAGNKFQEIATHRVTFKRPFAAPPRILLSGRGLALYSDADTRGTFFQLHTRNVGKEGFDLVIQGAYARSFSSVTVDWIAAGCQGTTDQWEKGTGVFSRNGRWGTLQKMTPVPFFCGGSA